MRVRVTNARHDYWYSNCLGRVFHVELVLSRFADRPHDAPTHQFYQIVGSDRLIRLSDAVRLPEPKL